MSMKQTKEGCPSYREECNIFEEVTPIKHCSDPVEDSCPHIHPADKVKIVWWVVALLGDVVNGLVQNCDGT
jgi:hypothetical protein